MVADGSALVDEAETEAMRRAVDLAGTPHFRSGGNPRVGCVILSADGAMVGQGWHRGAGHAHAEVMALAAAGPRAQDGTAVVTLEPCAHVGRTGPCAAALIAAGIRRVVFSEPDPDPVAAGGASALRDAGIDVAGPVRDAGAARLTEMWAAAVRRGRPFVLLKLAASLDGRIAAADGSSRWLTGPEARLAVHGLRASVDAVMVGTGTALADDPMLTVRLDPPDRVQPLRVVLGEREIPADARLRDQSEPMIQLRTRDLAGALSDLYARGVRSVLLEGGRSLATAMLDAGLIDRIEWFVAPVVVGDTGLAALGDLGVASVDDIVRFSIVSHERLGPDLRVRLEPSHSGE